MSRVAMSNIPRRGNQPIVNRSDRSIWRQELDRLDSTSERR